MCRILLWTSRNPRKSPSKLAEWRVKLWIEISQTELNSTSLGDFLFIAEVVEGVNPNTSNIFGATSGNCVMGMVGKFLNKTERGQLQAGEINTTAMWVSGDVILWFGLWFNMNCFLWQHRQPYLLVCVVVTWVADNTTECN